MAKGELGLGLSGGEVNEAGFFEDEQVVGE
jgi:hypothetical protein